MCSPSRSTAARSLAVQGEPQPGHLDRLLRLAQPRCRARRRPRLPRAARRQGARARPEDGSRRVDAPARPVGEGPDDHRGTALPRREDLHRRRRGGLRDAGIPRGDGRVHGASEWRFYTIPAPASPGRDVARGRRLRKGRRLDLGDAGVRQGARTCSMSRRQRRERLVRRRPAGRQPVCGVDRGDRPRAGEVPLALPGGAPRHLGPRRAEARWCSFDSHGRPRRASPRPARRLAVPARPRDREASVRDRREAGAPGARNRRRRRRSRSRATASPSPTPPDSPGDRAGEKPDPDAAKKLTFKVVPAETMYYAPPSTTNASRSMPGAAGGDNWEPSSYSPKTHMFYVCSAVQTVGGWQGSAASSKEGKLLRHRRPSPAPPATESSGTFTAIDAPNGERRRGRRSGPSPATAARSRRQATSSSSAAEPVSSRPTTPRNGELLWSFQTGAGANDAATDVRAGRQAIRRLPRGRATRLQATRARRQLWLFSLERHGRPGRGARHGHRHRARGRGRRRGGHAEAATRRPARGSSPTNCAGCHGAIGPAATAAPT